MGCGVRWDGEGRRGGRLTLARVLLEHRGEVEFDFRAILHSSLLTVARERSGELWRLLSILLTRPDSQLSAAVAGWNRPLSVEAFFLGSLYTAWVGEPHPLMPEAPERTLSDLETRLADMALEAMNRR